MRFQQSLAMAVLVTLAAGAGAAELPDTRPLTRKGDLAMQMVDGIDHYLMRELDAAPQNRQKRWQLNCSSREAYRSSLAPHRERLERMLGVVDSRVTPVTMELVATTEQPALVARGTQYRVLAVRWPVLPGVEGEGLLLEPEGKVKAQVVALPDADQTPEMIVGLAAGVPPEKQFARLLAENGCRVVVPVLIDRQDQWSGSAAMGRWTNQPHREFVYRMAYEMGRHIIGYEVQKVRAAVTWLTGHKQHAPVAVYGYGEGGLVALYSAALDERIELAAVSGYFGPREQLWREPIYRNVFGLLEELGDAEVARLVAPRFLLVDAGTGPTVEGPPAPRQGRGGAAPGRLEPVAVDRALQETKRAAAFYEQVKGLAAGDRFVVVEPGKSSLVEQTLKSLNIERRASREGQPAQDQRRGFDPAVRQKRQLDQLIAFTQKVMRSSERLRQRTFWDRLDTSSIEKYRKSCVPLQQQLWQEVIGKLPGAALPMNPQSRLLYDTQKWRGYEVTLDLYPDVFAYGILLVPRDLRPGEKRPVVVCQHGLEGRPSDVCNPQKRTPYYNSFGAQLADRGYIVYAPQNPYIGQDRFRVLQRKANPLGLSLFSFIIAQHGLTLEWLASLPFVDDKRMAFYGLSYGGKTAMRVPAVLPQYCLSICSGDFNEWIRKNVSLDYPSSYMFSPEYEMPEFNLGHTFNYAEMAALIAPRPFMVERGHDDGVGIDEWVAYEYARVRRLYSRLKAPQDTAIEFFAGGHEVRGQGTFRFLQEQLHWPPEKPSSGLRSDSR